MMEFEARLRTDDGTVYTLSEELTVGRSDDCDITLPSSKVSRQHARFRLSDGGVTVEDLGSSNGTRLNGRAIGPAQALMDGDKVGIDTFTLNVEIASPASGDDATVIAAPADVDETVIAPAAEKAPAPERDPPPAAATAPEPAKAPEPPPAPEPAVPPAGDLPGSW